MDRELRLNSIDRYVKRSPHFVLEEHGHCEVPAGCGGVVLRWLNPATTVPVRLELWVTASGDHGAVGDAERGEQAGDAVTVVAVAAPLGHAGHHRQHGWDRSRACMPDFSSTHSTTARSGGLW